MTRCCLGGFGLGMARAAGWACDGEGVLAEPRTKIVWQDGSSLP